VGHYHYKRYQSRSLVSFVTLIFTLFALLLPATVRAQVANPQTGSIGIEGTVPTEPPSIGATISFPTNGQSFSQIPITVSGICPADLLVKIFKNQVFAGAVSCTPQGTFELQIDLFSGDNELVARVFDNLDQPGPDSNIVRVTYNDPTSGVEVIEQLILTSNYALRGANAGTVLRWPMALAGGTGPYAVSVDWGDGETTQIPLNSAGSFTPEHTYFEPGVYQLTVKATDSRGQTAYLQLVAVSNGQAGQDNTGAGPTGGSLVSRLIIPMWPIYLMFFFMISTFWLGRRYELRRIKDAVRSGKAVKL
jgi:hypothetical protein